MLSKLKQITILKNERFQSFEDIKESTIQLKNKIDGLNNKIKIAKENYLLLKKIDNEFQNKINEVNEYQKITNINELKIQLTKSTNDLTKINKNLVELENKCLQKSNKLKNLLNSFLQ